jgi:hypothetical protein
MVRSPLQKSPLRPLDLFEKRRGELRSRQTNMVISQALRSRRREHPLIITLFALLFCVAIGIGVASVAWLIFGSFAIFRF